MDDLLPLLLWVFAVVWMLSVCGICIVRSRFGTGERHPEVNPVSWNVVLAQICLLYTSPSPRDTR